MQTKHGHKQCKFNGVDGIRIPAANVPVPPWPGMARIAIEVYEDVTKSKVLAQEEEDGSSAEEKGSACAAAASSTDTVVCNKAGTPGRAPCTRWLRRSKLHIGTPFCKGGCPLCSPATELAGVRGAPVASPICPAPGIRRDEECQVGCFY